MDCMKAHATKLRIATNHRNMCQESGTRDIVENTETPEATGELFHEYYTTDKIARKVLKEEFKKRYINYKNNQKNKIFKIITIIGIVTLIYALTFLIMRSALKNTKDQDIGYKPATTKPEFRETPTNKIKIENNKLEKENKQKTLHNTQHDRGH